MSITIRIAVTLLLLLSALSVTAASRRQAIFVSDLHVGAGRTPTGEWRRIEDFRWQREFDQFLDFIEKKSSNNTDLVFVGDVFELWQSPTMACSDDVAKPGCIINDCMESSADLGCSEAEALERLKYVLAQHPDFIASLRKFASSGTNRAFIVPGNHDAALLFPALTNHLTQQFNSTRVSVVTSGYWLSDDSAIYADHGHQFDELNKMKNWPKPFVTSDGVERMQKPWGENMVQQFYNQYEFVFPVIDNVADEASGVSFAINDAGFNRTTSAVGKFFRFFLFEQSMRQTASVLSTDPAADPPKWDKAAVQKKPISFFVEGLQGDSKLTESATKAMASMDVQFDPTKLEDDEVKQICDLKLVLKGKGESIEQCPTTDGKLSSISN